MSAQPYSREEIEKYRIWIELSLGSADPATAAMVRLLATVDSLRADIAALTAESDIRQKYALGMEEACDKLESEIAAKDALLRLALRWLGTSNATEAFDDIAEWFWKETGIDRPGKSVPTEVDYVPIEKRQQAFADWCKSKKAEIIAKLTSALSSVPGSKPTQDEERGAAIP